MRRCLKLFSGIAAIDFVVQPSIKCDGQWSNSDEKMRRSLEEKWRSLIEDHDIYLKADLKMSAISGRGLFTRVRAKRGDVLGIVPRTLFLRMAGKEDLDVQEWIFWMALNLLKLLDEDTIGASNIFWRRYSDFLPDQVLAPVASGKGVKDPVSIFRDQMLSFFSMTFPGKVPPERFIWACEIVASRSFGNSTSTETEFMMVPFLDMCNHSEDFNSIFFLDEKGASILAFRDLEVGDEIRTKYLDPNEFTRDENIG